PRRATRRWEPSRGARRSAAPSPIDLAASTTGSASRRRPSRHRSLRASRPATPTPAPTCPSRPRREAGPRWWADRRAPSARRRYGKDRAGSRNAETVAFWILHHGPELLIRPDRLRALRDLPRPEAAESGDLRMTILRLEVEVDRNVVWGALGPALEQQPGADPLGVDEHRPACRIELASLDRLLYFGQHLGRRFDGLIAKCRGPELRQWNRVVAGEGDVAQVCHATTLTCRHGVRGGRTTTSRRSLATCCGAGRHARRSPRSTVPALGSLQVVRRDDRPEDRRVRGQRPHASPHLRHRRPALRALSPERADADRGPLGRRPLHGEGGGRRLRSRRLHRIRARSAARPFAAAPAEFPALHRRLADDPHPCDRADGRGVARRGGGAALPSRCLLCWAP